MSITQGGMTKMVKNLISGGLGTEKIHVKEGKTIEEEAQFFNSMYQDKEETKNRKNNAPKMVDSFYNLVTNFYESGWGQSFHFAPRSCNESFRESIARHEYYIAAKLKLSVGEEVLDAGCGIGGPMRNIAKFTGAKITGVTINSYQVERGNSLNQQYELDHLCRIEEGNFLNLKYLDNTFDKIFCIEASCHAPERTRVFGEIFRVLKPGGLFATYEWVLTDEYDETNPIHKRSKQQIEEGNALPDLIHASKAVAAFKEVGFDVVLEQDIHKFSSSNNQIPWYASLEAKCSLENLPHTTVGTVMTNWLCWTLEKIGLAQKGTYAAHQVLLTAREGLVVGGRLGIFTPMLLLVGRKPSD